MRSVKIKLTDVKQALLDPRFTEKLPEDFQPDLRKFNANPGCACNHPIYRMVLQKYPDLIKEYYPHKEDVSPDEEDRKLLENHWRVINCSAFELEGKLRTLPPGRKQIAIARHEDQVTVIVNELDVVI